VPPKPRAGTAAERMSELKLQARRAPRLSDNEQHARQAARGGLCRPSENSGRNDEKAEAAGGGEHHACQGDELHARRAARGGLCRPSRG